MGKKFSKSKGITLIALVVTIVVLLILAGVSIAMLAGEDGIIKQANNAKVESVHGQVAEAMVLEYGEYQIELKTSKVASLKVSAVATGETQTFIEYLTDKEIVNESGVVNVVKLTGKKLSLGNGTDNETDVYKMVTQEGYYKLNYYGKDKAELELEEFVITGQAGGSGGIEKVEPENISDWEYRVEDDNTITITMYKGTDTEIVVPNYINNMPVKRISTNEKEVHDYYNWIKEYSLWSTSICEGSYNDYDNIENYWQKTITKITISNGIETIDDYAFYNTTNLKELILPSTLVSFGEHFIDGCGSVKISIKNSISNIEKVEPENIADWEYREENDGTITITKYKGTDKEVVIPNYINNIPVKKISTNAKTVSDGGGTFTFSSLWDVNICEKEYNHYGEVYRYSQNTITKLIISDGIEIMDGSVFQCSYALQEIIIPTSLEMLNDDVPFYGCDNLTTIKYKGSELIWNIYKKSRNFIFYYDTDKEIIYNYSE